MTTLGDLQWLAEAHPEQAEGLALRWSVPLAVLLGLAPAHRVKPRRAKLPAPPKPIAPRPQPAVPLGPDYRTQVAQAVMRARAAIASGVPRQEAARDHGVPVRLWARL